MSGGEKKEKESRKIKETRVAGGKKQERERRTHDGKLKGERRREEGQKENQMSED